MVLVSLAVAALVVLAVLLTVLQCVKVRRGRVGAKRAKRSEASGDSGEDSDYSSYDGEEEEETRLGDTVMSDTSSVQVSLMRVTCDDEATCSEPPASPKVTETASECDLCVPLPREADVLALWPRGREADPSAPGPYSVLIPEAGPRAGPRPSAPSSRRSGTH